MNLRNLKLFALCLCVSVANLSAFAQLKITASVTVTNKTTNGIVFTLNGDTRTFTNNVVNTATQVATNADATGCGSKTNLLTQIRLTPFSQVSSVDVSSNSFNLVGNADLPMNLTLTAGYASVSYSTQTVTTIYLAQVPVSGLPTAIARTNVASGIAAALNAVENTNPVHQASLAMSELMGTTNSQTISALKRFTNSAGEFWGIISNSPAISGTVIALIGGLFTAPFLDGATITNGVNYGNAFSSPGTGVNSEQFGDNALAQGDNSTVVGRSAAVLADSGTAVGNSAGVAMPRGIAIGYNSQVGGTANDGIAIGTSASSGADSGVALGNLSAANGTNSVAIGTSATANHNNSIAIGTGVSSTSTNQIILGGPNMNAVVQNNLNVGGTMTVSGNVTITGSQSSSAFSGTNNFLANSDIAFTRKAVNTIANGNNSGVVVGTNVFCELSGNSAGFAIAGFAGGRDGKLIYVVNQTGFAWTNLNESGLEATPANRIRTLGNASDLALTNGACTFIYSGAVSRWLLIAHNP